MICLDCVHLISRAFSNGQFIEKENYCDLDGLRLLKNVSECNRMSRPEIVDPIPTIQEVAELNAPKGWKGKKRGT